MAAEENMNKKPPPELPHGWTSTLSGLSETFAFHSSPESFISSRVAALQKTRPDVLRSRAVVRARILNRDVAVVSSHAQIRHILDQPEDAYYGSSSSTRGAEGEEDGGKTPTFVAADAYSQFMGPFYPGPNLLLMDGPGGREHRNAWRERMAGIKPADFAARLAREHLGSLAGRESPTSLYAEMKTLCWKILFGAFLKLEEGDAQFAEIKNLQEDLLHGQFSLFPVTVNLGIWHSPRKRGKDAKDKLRKLILERIAAREERCPFPHHGGDKAVMEDYANHLLMFSSSLAVKGLASLLTVFLLNLYLFRDDDGETAPQSLCKRAAGMSGEERRRFLTALFMETQRLSPPIVGIMRRVTQDTVLPSPDEAAADTLLPRGWDVWLYFAGGGRDPEAFGDDADRFVPGRYLGSGADAAGSCPRDTDPLAFSLGPKRCLGKDVMQDIVVAVGEALLLDGLRIEGEVEARGVRGWLGWELVDGVADWEKDVKQLPTQHPARPILVRVIKKP